MSLSEAIKRLKLLSLPQDYPEDVDLIRLIDYRSFMNCINNEVRCAILTLISKGITSAADIAKYLNISRTGIYRHLNVLARSGFLMHMNGKYYISAKIFLIYDVDIDSDGFIKLKIHPDKGGFVDEEAGFVLIKGPICKCEVCRAFDTCIKAVKSVAKKLDIRIRSENPLQAFTEIIRELIYRDVYHVIRNGYLIVRPVYIEEEEEEKLEEARV
jgi:biotin operon repressor